ncbi:MAG: anti-sigma factor [Chitinophagaceae bacterium]|nr:MAG: anti-sigma factor [Chitinophagaceae bacterium]
MSEQWIERLKHFEAPPPAAAWDRVEESLDAAPLAGRLQEFAAPPPPGLWDRIESELDAPAAGPAIEAPVLPRRRRNLVPYLAAAAVVGAILVATPLLFQRSGPAPVAHQDRPSVSTGTQPATVPEPGSDTGAAQTTIARVPPAESLDTEPAPDRPETRTVKPAPRSHTGALSASIAGADRYLVRTHQDGHKVRLSKKVSPVFDCAEHSTGFSWSLCQVSIGVLQEKLAAEPSAVNTDFGGLIDRLMDLESKNNSR